MNKEQRTKRIELGIGIGAPLLITLVLCFVPGLILLIWIVQWLYVIPAIVVLSILKRRWLVASMLITVGSVMILDIAFCGYASSHGTSFIQ